MMQGSRLVAILRPPAGKVNLLKMEPTFVLSEHFALGFMFLNAWQPGYSPQFAGWRVLPHVYAPEAWHLPGAPGFRGGVFVSEDPVRGELTADGTAAYP
jgi:hypothetical protein